MLKNSTTINDPKKAIDVIVYYNGEFFKRDLDGSLIVKDGKHVVSIGNNGKPKISYFAFSSDPGGMGVEEVLGSVIMKKLGLDNGSATGNRVVGGSEVTLDELNLLLKDQVIYSLLTMGSWYAFRICGVGDRL